MGAWSNVIRLGCAGAAIVMLVGCARQGGGAATNASAPAVNAMTPAANSPAANTSQNDLFDTNAANSANATNAVDPAEASLLFEKNADCVDQLIKAQPFGESRSQIIDNVTKGCLPIAELALQSSPNAGDIRATERSFVTGRAHELIDGTSAQGSGQPTAQGPAAGQAPPSTKSPATD